jgi:glutathione S-transferase
VSEIRLFSARACPYAHRTRLVLAEKALAFELIEIDLQNKPSWFDATISAYGKVPALAHGDVHIWESAVINEYLEEAFPAPALLPRTPAARAHARIAIDYANQKFSPAYHAFLRATQPDAQRELETALAFLENELLAKSDGPFFLGSLPSLVDYTLYPWFERWPALAHFRGLEIPAAHTRLHRWLSAIAARPAVIAERSPSEFYIERYGRFVTRT